MHRFMLYSSVGVACVTFSSLVEGNLKEEWSHAHWDSPLLMAAAKIVTYWGSCGMVCVVI